MFETHFGNLIVERPVKKVNRSDNFDLNYLVEMNVECTNLMSIIVGSKILIN